MGLILRPNQKIGPFPGFSLKKSFYLSIYLFIDKRQKARFYKFVSVINASGTMFRRILTSAAAGVLRSKVKETTGFVGLDAVPTRREVLASLYTKTLKKIQAVETFTKLRLEVCQEEEDWEMIVEQYGCDQIDNLIERAQNELKFISKMMGSFFFTISMWILFLLLDFVCLCLDCFCLIGLNEWMAECFAKFGFSSCVSVCIGF